MKFDVIIGNPPYQAPITKNNLNNYAMCGSTIWDKFVKKSIDLVSENGYVCLIHPSKWRNPESKLWNVMSKNQIHYLEIHNMNDGLKTFNAATRYDWYIMQKTSSAKPITVKGEDGEIHKINLSEWTFLPNGIYEFISKIVAKGEEKRCEILYSRFLYKLNKSNMSKVKIGEFIHPCVRYISAKDGKIDCWYSNNKDHGHFGVKKVIFGIGCNCGSFYKDITGEYGMSQYAAGVVADNDEELDFIFKAMNTKRFMKVMTYCMTTTQKVNYRILQCFRKDFWREFVNEDGTEIKS